MNEPTFKATGMKHYMNGLMALASANSDYRLSSQDFKEEFEDGDRVYENNFYFSRVELLPEPDNQYDPNAIAVYIDGNKVGHVKKEDCTEVRSLISSDKFDHIEATVGGGKYRELKVEDDEPIIDSGFINYYVHFTIFSKNETISSIEKVEKAKKKSGGLGKLLSIILWIIGVIAVLAGLTSGTVPGIIVGVIIIVIAIISRKKKEK